jgi:tryptophan synthase alpha chain
MTTALETRLKELKSSGEKGFIPFVTAGDPDLETTAEILIALTKAGASAIEVGVPFSDPIADGPTIQAAGQRAIQAGTTLEKILDMLEGIPTEDIAPIVIFSYLNPIDRFGFEAFAKRAKEVGVSALLLTDATPGTEPDLEEQLRAHGLDLICLVAPTTPESRLQAIADRGSGFIYMVARRGVTGEGAEQIEVRSNAERLRELTDTPLYIGFGVRTREDVLRLQKEADGVVVGSALVKTLHDTPREKRADRAEAFVRELLGK